MTPLVDVRPGEFGKCHDTFVYITDVTTFGLIVYDHVHARSWRIKNNLFYPYPPYGSFEIRDEHFDLMDGILGLALSPLKLGRDRVLYFHSLASRTESWVYTSVIRLVHSSKRRTSRDNMYRQLNASAIESHVAALSNEITSGRRCWKCDMDLRFLRIT